MKLLEKQKWAGYGCLKSNLSRQPKQTLPLMQEASFLSRGDARRAVFFSWKGCTPSLGYGVDLLLAQRLRCWVWSCQQHFRFRLNISPLKTARAQCTYVLICDTVTVQCSMASGSENCNCFSCEVESMYNARGIGD